MRATEQAGKPATGVNAPIERFLRRVLAETSRVPASVAERFAAHLVVLLADQLPASCVPERIQAAVMKLVEERGFSAPYDGAEISSDIATSLKTDPELQPVLAAMRRFLRAQMIAHPNTGYESTCAKLLGRCQVLVAVNGGAR